MEKEVIFSIFSFLAILVSGIVFWTGVFRKKVIPHPFTYFIWVVGIGISAWELVQAGEMIGAIPLIILTSECLIALIVGTIWYKRIEINWIDYFFVISGILLIIYWQLEPNYAHVLWIMIGIDIFAYAISFKKTWLQPFTESSFSYFLASCGNICTIFAISVWNFENLGMWIWTAGMNLVFTCLIFFRQKFTNR